MGTLALVRRPEYPMVPGAANEVSDVGGDDGRVATHHSPQRPCHILAWALRSLVAAPLVPDPVCTVVLGCKHMWHGRYVVWAVHDMGGIWHGWYVAWVGGTWHGWYVAWVGGTWYGRYVAWAAHVWTVHGVGSMWHGHSAHLVSCVHRRPGLQTRLAW